MLCFVVLWHVNCAVNCSTLLWRHNGHDGVSNHQPYDCLLTGEFPVQRASNAENVSIWWRHDETAVEDGTLVPNYMPRNMDFVVHALIAVNLWVNSSLPGQNGRHFADDILTCIFMNEKGCISIRISFQFVPKGPIDNMSALVQVMAWRRTGDKPLPDPRLTQSTDSYIPHSGDMS